MADLLTELGSIKEAAEAAAVGIREGSLSGSPVGQDPLLTDWLAGVVNSAEGYINQLTPRAAGTDVQFAEPPMPQQAAQPPPESEAPVGTAAPEAANADVGGAEDEPA